MAKLLSMREYAKHRAERGLVGATAPAVSDAVKSKRITTIDGKIDPSKADIEWERNTRKKASHQSHRAKSLSVDGDAVVALAGDGETMQDAQRRYEIARANKAEVEALKASGEYAKLSDIVNALGGLVSAAKSVLLRAGNKLAPVVAIESDPAKCEALIEEELHAALSELSTWEPAHT